ncbi:MAG: hypothetical protein GX299_02985 [Epulopiscium sp.]|jgi:hypothetical protein|nr:hypothetical protein [Candidatus Epulonipiscium sp.]
MLQNKKNKDIAASEQVLQDSPFFDLLEQYLDEHPKTGYLVFQVTQESPLQGKIPIPNAKITISKNIGGEHYISKVLTTNSDGKTEALALPTVSAELSRTPSDGEVYAKYNATISAPNFVTKDIYDIPIFEGITSIQPVVMELDYTLLPTYQPELDPNINPNILR